MYRTYLNGNDIDVIKSTGNVEYLEILEGTLLDNELFEVNGVMYLAYEHVLNSNNSNLLVEIATSQQDKEILLSYFEMFKKSYINDRIWDYIHYSRFAIDNNLKRDVLTSEKVYDPEIVNRCMKDFYNDCVESLEYYCDKEDAKRYIRDYIRENESKYY